MTLRIYDKKDDSHTNTKCYISIDGLPDDAFEVGWVEFNGDLVIRYDPDSVRRLEQMFAKPREILMHHKDPELADIKDDMDFCIDFVRHVIDTCYDKREEKTNA